jgi:hypothetical protein
MCPHHIERKHKLDIGKIFLGFLQGNVYTHHITQYHIISAVKKKKKKKGVHRGKLHQLYGELS